ncbi:MAG: pilus assembly protein PilM, partial [Candidatus Omnitrophica bacterium]|nr:pilus assembly protein PilM [Candidatus Omnitrophota bacterium]
MFGSRKKKETIIIALGANFLKLGVFRQQGAKKELVNLVFRDIPGTSDADIAKAVTESIAGLKVKDANISIVVPAGVVITKNIDVPSTNPAEIKEITSLQAGRHTPYSREEIIADHIDIGVYKKNYTKILMVIVPSKIIKKQLDVLSKAGVKADKILFAPELTAWSIGKVLRLDTNSQPAALLVVDRDTCDFSVVHRSKLIFVRSIPLGAALLAKEPDKNNARLCEEVKKSFEAYQAEDVEKAPKGLYVCGAVDKLDTVTAMLEELTKVSVAKIPYMKNIAMSRPVIEFLSHDIGVSFF